MKRSWHWVLCFLLGFFLVFAWGCAKRTPTEASRDEKATCEGCHLNKDLLKATVSAQAEEPTGEAGEG